jgi:hypothetical protein
MILIMPYVCYFRFLVDKVYVSGNHLDGSHLTTLMVGSNGIAAFILAAGAQMMNDKSREVWE